LTSPLGRCVPAAFAAGAFVLGCPSTGGHRASSDAADAGSGTVAEAGAQSSLRWSPASVAAVVNPLNLPAYSGATGTVDGTVLVRGPPSPDVPGLDVHACPSALDTYGKLFREGPSRADSLRPLADALVVITGYGGYYVPDTREARRATITSKCGYETRTIALTFGQRLEIENDSTVPFAPYLEGEPVFTVMVAPPERKGEPATIFPGRADYFSLRDRLQPFVHEDVYVLRQPLHAVTDTRGRFWIDGVPTGKLKIGARLAAIFAETTADIEVRAGAVERPELVLTYAPKTH
jgi:hypothetical protein